MGVLLTRDGSAPLLLLLSFSKTGCFMHSTDWKWHHTGSLFNKSGFTSPGPHYWLVRPTGKLSLHFWGYRYMFVKHCPSFRCLNLNVTFSHLGTTLHSRHCKVICMFLTIQASAHYSEASLYNSRMKGFYFVELIWMYCICTRVM